MKIVGKTNDGYILSCSERELANLLGYASFATAARDHYKYREPGVGAEIRVSDMYNQLAQWDTQRGEVTQAQAMLRGVADFIEPIKRLLQPEEEADGGG